MNIYNSTQVRPYVYFCVHRITGHIYIGFREANTLPSDQDFPLYRTSSKIVNPNFGEYDWYIVAEFTNGNDAYDFEQQLICENWSNSLLLNGVCFFGKARFKARKGVKKKPRTAEHRANLSLAGSGRTGPIQSAETIAKRVAKLVGKKRTDEFKHKQSALNKGRPSWHNGRKKSDETIARMHEGNKKRPAVTKETREKMRQSHLGQQPSPETIEKRRISLRAAWVRRKLKLEVS